MDNTQQVNDEQMIEVNDEQMNEAEENQEIEIVVFGDKEKDGEFIKLKSKDNKVIFDVPLLWLKSMCGLIDHMTEEKNEDDCTVPLSEIHSSETLRRVIEYCKHHHNNRAPEIEKPIKKNLTDIITDEWDLNNVMNLGKDLLFELTLAANYINCDDLLQLCCAEIAEQVKGKTIEDMREYFGVVNDFTPEEEEVIRKENEWMDE